MAAFGEVIYATPGYPPDPDADPEWAIRVANHKAGRPASWRTVETTDLVGVLADADAPVLVDCLGTWMTRVLDTLDAWELPAGEAAALAEREIAELAAGLAACEQPVTVVTNEVGWGLVPPYASGRLFSDLLGRTNQEVGAVCDEVHVVVSGRVLVLTDSIRTR
jgi:adenosylcobinamide kinase/adenosylcobinamide-phosphate guanylyltransferase